MKITETPLKGAFIIEPSLFKDKRGFFSETYNRRIFEQNGLFYSFVQDNHSYSKEKGVLRGLHFQKPPHAQSKLVRVVKGRIYDVIVDLRTSSESYGEYFAEELSDKNMRMLIIPKGFAHAYCTLEPDSVVLYKVDEFYFPQSESGIVWNDPDLNIKWPFRKVLLSDKDSRLPLMRETVGIF